MGKHRKMGGRMRESVNNEPWYQHFFTGVFHARATKGDPLCSSTKPCIWQLSCRAEPEPNHMNTEMSCP